MDNYSKLLERISGSAEMDREEIERRIEAKRAKLSGLISKEGAAQIVAAELGISFEGEKLKISELVQGMKRANAVGQITRMFPVREFNKNGREGKIGSFLMGDETSNIRVVLWDVNHISLIEKGDLKEGDTVEIMNGNIRNGEMHLSGFSDVKKSKEKIENVHTKRDFEEVRLKDAGVGANVKIRAVIVHTFEPRYFESKKDGKKGVLFNIVLDDGSENMRAVLFNDNIKELGFEEDELFSAEKFNLKREDLLGEERFFIGNVRTNSFFNNTEISINGVEDINLDLLVADLEKKV